MENELAKNGCPFLGGCPFFNENMRAFPVGAELMKDQFCRGEFSRCARYIIATQLGRDKMPSMMFPNQMDRAKKVLEEHGVQETADSGASNHSSCRNEEGC